jgi:anaerobic magnesium-protoporphyrin IX monomethyl ester cyclase
MNVLLLAPSYPIEEFPSPPLGLCYAAAGFQTAGCNVRILDFIVQHYSVEKLKKELDAFGPDIVGTNSVTMNHDEAVSLLKDVKDHNPGIITLMGGPHISFDYEGTLKNHPEIDMAVIGEGEKTINELVPVIHNRGKWCTINGIAYMENDHLVKTPKREFISDLDTLPQPPRHLLPLSKYLALGLPISIITSRGCPNQCIFCVGSKMVGQKFRTRSISLILDEIQSLIEIGFEQINFADDFFTVNKKRVKAICAEIKARNLNFGWSIFARADSVNRDILQTMKDAGCHTVLFGIESGNQEMLDRINKRIKLDQIKQAVSLCKDVGMRVLGSFIVGLPGETSETLIDSHKLAQELDVPYGYHFLSPFPGTTLKEKISDYDLQLLTHDWSKFDANQAIVRTSSLSPEEITQFVEDYSNKKNRSDEEELAKRFAQGQCTPTELLVIHGNQKMDVVYALLSKDVIESLDAFPKSNGSELGLLVEDISRRIQIKPEIVKPAMEHLISRGYVKKQEDGGKIKWLWT